MLLAHNHGNILFSDEDIPNLIATYNFRQENKLIVVNPNRPRHFRLDAANHQQLLALNDV